MIPEALEKARLSKVEPSEVQRSHFRPKRLATRAAPIAPIQETRRERAFATGPPNTRFPAHIAEDSRL
jgi:hypothetical protein